MLIRKWIQTTTAEQKLKKNRLTNRRSKLGQIEMHVNIVNAFGGHVPPSKTLTLFESKALISLVLP